MSFCCWINTLEHKFSSILIWFHCYFKSVKLSSIKVDSRFTTTTQIVKLAGSQTISKIFVKIGDIKRTKMVSNVIVCLFVVFTFSWSACVDITSSCSVSSAIRSKLLRQKICIFSWITALLDYILVVLHLISHVMC